MDSRRDFIRKATLLSAGTGLLGALPPAIQRAFAIDPEAGSTFLDAEHIVFLMQENRSFDHAFGTLNGVRGFNDPRAIHLPNGNKVWLQTNKEGETYAPFRLDIKNTKATWMSSLPHSWTNQVDARNNGSHDKWLDAKHSGEPTYAKMPLTLGYYTREDIPFYYALADAFTICDQNFCSSLTGTTPNRLFFCTGTIRQEPKADAMAHVWNENADPNTYVNWKTYPERLEENGVSWKMYQNELYLDVGFEGEEEGWLSNFGDNPIEYFSQYQVKFSKAYIDNLPNAAKKIAAEIVNIEKELEPAAANEDKKPELQKRLERAKSRLAKNAQEQQQYTAQRYEQLTAFERAIHEKAFSTNTGDPNYHQLETLQYEDGGVKREMKVPAGDVLHQFREDVKNGKLPTVSWITAPENFSDHPSSAWYGAWYISEVMDILTQNPEVWKKTIFVITYDENDGYFDHVPPFVAPNPYKSDSGLVSNGIDPALDFVTRDQQSYKDQYARESSIGLGYRVPMLIISPWSRGGWVNSQVFDHTSSLQFLEYFLDKKFGKKVVETNISEWRRTVCGDLTSAFRPWNGEAISSPTAVERNPFLEKIHQAKFKGLPMNYKKLSDDEINLANNAPADSAFMPRQEKGSRPSCSLPYELYADGRLSADKKTFDVRFRAGDFFAERSAGAAFNLYTPGVYNGEHAASRAYAVKAGDALTDSWAIGKFENGNYHFRIHGPNGFFREFAGNASEPIVDIHCGYTASAKNITGKLELIFTNEGGVQVEIIVTDNAYHTVTISKKVAAKQVQKILVDTGKSDGWYDFSITIKGLPGFERRYAGRVETGKPSKTDPAIG